MKAESRQSDAGADEFWVPSLSQQIAACREADRVAFATGWTRISYIAAAALALAACAWWAF